MAPKVYSYARWSTPEQRDGDSARRQLEAAREYAAAHGMDVDEELRDDGRSAFRGKNLKRGENPGALGRFLERIEAGEIEPGSVLVLENLDRMSRQAPLIALEVLAQITKAGVAVHTTNDGQTYTRERLLSPDGLQSLLIALLAFNTANQESEKKRRRLQDVWKNKRANAARRPMTGTCPRWLRLNDETGTWEVIPERAEVIRRIYRDAAAGKGVHTIARELNEEGVPVFTKGKRAPKMWQRSYIVKVLDSEAVIGTLIPCVIVYDETGRERRVPQEPIPNYYPAIVDRDLYEQVRALRFGSPHPLRGRAASKEVRNLFGGLLRCARCGGSVYREGKGRARPWYLICNRAKHGAGCIYQTTHYHVVEEQFIAQAGELIASVPVGEGAEAIQTALDRATESFRVTEELIADLNRDLKASYSPALSLKLREALRERDSLEEERQALQRQLTTISGAFLDKRLTELQQVLTTEPLDRARGNALLRVLAKAVLLDLDAGNLTVQWRAGGESVVPIFAPGFGFPVDPKAPDGAAMRREAEKRGAMQAEVTLTAARDRAAKGQRRPRGTAAKAK